MSIKLRGFTLIELLVVIAIIGVLATVVIGSVNSARVKGADAAIKGNISNVRASAEVIYDETTTGYQTVCATTSKTYDGVLAAGQAYLPATTVAASTAGAAVSTSTTVATACSSNSVSWAAVTLLKSGAGSTAWCADSAGSNKQIAASSSVVTIAAAAGTPATVKCP